MHYGGGPTPAGITHQQAGDLAAMAENAYTTLVTDWGYPAPLNDGDGRTDIWVEDHSLLGIPGLLGYAEQDTPGDDLHAAGSRWTSPRSPPKPWSPTSSCT